MATDTDLASPAHAVSADGTRIGWRKAGAGPPAVCLHGTSGAKSNWAMTGDFLEQALTVYAVDRRGRGGSSDAEAYAFEREVEDVAAVAAAIGEPPHLVGHSFGAVLALAAAAAGVPVRSLVLYEPPLLAHEVLDVPTVIARCESALDRDAREECVAAFYGAIGEQARLEMLRGFPPAWEQIMRDAHTIPRELKASIEWTLDSFGRVDVPVLLLVGSETHEAFRRSIAELGEVLPRAETQVLSGQAHLAHALAPEAFADAVLSFTSRH